MMGKYSPMGLDHRLAGHVKDRQNGLELVRIHRIRILRRIYNVAIENGEMTSVAGHDRAALVDGRVTIPYNPDSGVSLYCGGSHGAVGRENWIEGAAKAKEGLTEQCLTDRAR